MNKIDIHAAVSALLTELQKAGNFTVRMHHDIEGLEAAHKSLGKSETGENFRKALDTLPPNRFFWLSANDENRVIGTVAVRLDDSEWTLQKFTKNYWERAFKGAGEAPVQLAENSPSMASDYIGRFAYLGEAVVDPDIRNNNISYVLVRLALIFAFDEWKPNVAYGWMRDWHAYRGLATRWGFNRVETNAFDWINAPAEEDWRNLAFLACDRQGWQNLLKHPAPRVLFDLKRNSQKRTERQSPAEQEQ